MSISSARDRNQFAGRPAPRPPRRGVCCKSEVKSAPGPHQTTGWSGAGMRTHAVSKPQHGQRYFYAETARNFSILNNHHLSKDFIVQIITFLQDKKTLHHLEVKAVPGPAHGSAPGDIFTLVAGSRTKTTAKVSSPARRERAKWCCPCQVRGK